MRKQMVTVLGSTGSIGKNTLDVIARHTDRFQVFALSAATQVEAVLAQIRVFSPTFTVMASPEHATLLAHRVLAEGLSTTVLSGPQALCDVARDERVDAVMAAIVGSAGLPSCMAAARAGKKLLLANKEALVVGGQCFMAEVTRGNATLLPIDSEHSAIFQSLPDDRSAWVVQVQKILLTASGGPFRTRDPATLSMVTPDEACAHPNWVMGRKISVDSATMMNKALEVIEAKFLFNLEPSQIEVVIHPQSVIHSMVEYVDSSVVAQLGTPDMRGPIAYGLSWPARIASGAPPIDFLKLNALTFEAPNPERFPGLALAWQSLAAVPGTPAVLNAANEIGVAAFLDGRLRFDQINALNEATLEAFIPASPHDLNDVIALDLEARSVAIRCLNDLAN